jgi:tetratricopeptide (TPR) repeat protein
LLLAGLGLLILAGVWQPWRLKTAAQGASHRPRYLLINETAQHDFDLALRMSLKLAEEQSGIENALVLLPALAPTKTIEETAAELFTKLQIGARDHGRGILYLYSAKENLLKIEVSFDLEGKLPDLYCRHVEEAAKTYMLSEVPQDFLSELIITTNLRGMATKSEGVGSAPPGWFVGDFLSGGGGALVHGYRKTLAEYQRAIERLPTAQLARFTPSRDADVSVRRYLESLDAGIGDPNLPLLTEGSRIFRAVVPRDAAQQRRILEYFAAAAPYQLFFREPLAIAAPKPGHSNLPIVLRHGTDGLWYVDEAKSWTYFHRYENNVNFFVKYADNPFLGELRAAKWPNMAQPIYGDHVRTPAMPAYPFALAQAVQALEARIRDQPKDPAGYAALGDLYLFEADWLSQATGLYETASRLAPDELSYHWRLADLYLNGSRADRFLGELKFLAGRLPGDRPLQDEYLGYVKAYESLGE